jgi:hypothetical protein
MDIVVFQSYNRSAVSAPSDHWRSAIHRGDGHHAASAGPPSQAGYEPAVRRKLTSATSSAATASRIAAVVGVAPAREDVPRPQALRDLSSEAPANRRFCRRRTAPTMRETNMQTSPSALCWGTPPCGRPVRISRARKGGHGPTSTKHWRRAWQPDVPHGDADRKSTPSRHQANCAAILQALHLLVEVAMAAVAGGCFREPRGTWPSGAGPRRRGTSEARSCRGGAQHDAAADGAGWIAECASVHASSVRLVIIGAASIGSLGRPNARGQTMMRCSCNTLRSAAPQGSRAMRRRSGRDGPGTSVGRAAVSGPTGMRACQDRTRMCSPMAQSSVSVQAGVVEGEAYCCV